MSKIKNRFTKETVWEHSWSPKRDQIVAAIEDKVVIYDCSDKDPKKWSVIHELEDHDLCVSSVDWSEKTNQIVSCSHDRNAFVWTYNKHSKKWLPKLVILRIDRAANKVRWSPDGKKFAVASSAKKVPVCHYEADQEWWIGNMIKKHKSSVLSVAWHPNSQLIVTGSCDFRCRVFCAFLPDVDEEQDSGPFEGKLEEDPEFGDLICEFVAKGWIESVAWAPSGKKLAFASHDSTLTVVDFSAEDVLQATIKLEKLPLRDILFVSDDRILGVGYDFLPYVFDNDSDEGWTLTCDIDSQGKKKATKKKQSAASFWQNKTNLGQSKAEKGLQTKHDNTITCVREKGGGVYTSSGLDGRIYEWKVKKAK
eukprot:g892.t1